MSQKCCKFRGFSTQALLKGDKRMLLEYDKVDADGFICPAGEDVENKKNRARYIPPGDLRSEYYRLATFSRFPDMKITKFWELPAAGFYCTGIGSGTKCFSCGSLVKNWTIKDNPFKQVWHKTECNMANGEDPDNKPFKCPRKKARELFEKWKESESDNQGMRNGIKVVRDHIVVQKETKENKEKADCDLSTRKETGCAQRFPLAEMAPRTQVGNVDVSEEQLSRDAKEEVTFIEQAPPSSTTDRRCRRSRKRSGTDPKGEVPAVKMNPGDPSL